MGPTSPYYLFGAQRRYAYAWSGRAGGVPPGHRAAETRELGNADMIESGLDPEFLPSPTLGHTIMHARLPPAVHVPVIGRTHHTLSGGMGDWPLRRPAGYEPDDPNQDGEGGLGFFDGLSDNEKKLAIAAGALAAGWLYFRRRKKARRRR